MRGEPLLVLLLALIGCTPAAQGNRDAGGSRGEAPVAPKTITIGVGLAVKGFGPWHQGTTSGGTEALREIYQASLASDDERGQHVGRLVERLPSFDDGTIVVLPDGRMQTIWRLRPGVLWHDGTPLTSEDFRLGFEILRHPDLPVGARRPAFGRFDSVDASDPLAVTITWKTTYYRALAVGVREFLPYPRSILAAPFEADPPSLPALDYWTTDYFHLGPFRLVDWGLGEHLVFNRFDGYFLGRPKIDTIIVRAILDTNTLLANLRGGAIDIAAEGALAGDLLVHLRDEWRQSGGGRVGARVENWRMLWVQMRPEDVQPPELAQDVRIRRGLAYAVDRAALRELVVPGFPDTEGDSFMAQTDPRAPLVGKPFAPFKYDPRRAIRELADAGWTRPDSSGRPDPSGHAPDGRMLNQTGSQVQLAIRASQSDYRELAVAADNIRSLGIDAQELIQTPAQSLDREWQARWSGLRFFARGSGDAIWTTFDGRLHSTPQNRFAGTNASNYANPALDRLIDRLYSTLDQTQQGHILREMGEILAADLPGLPLYLRMSMAAITSRVDALSDYEWTTFEPGTMSRNAHLWDRRSP